MASAVLIVAVDPALTEIPLTDGQVIQFEVEDGILEIEAPSLTLKVTATDAGGNTAVVEVQPSGLAGDNDDDALASAELDD